MIRTVIKTGFIIKGKSGGSQYHYANVKPLVDIGFGLHKIGVETILFIDETEFKLNEKINSITKGEINIIFYNLSNLNFLLEKSNINILVVDDDISFMEFILKSINKSIKKVVYVQYLYGVNTNKKEKRDKSISLKIGSNLPWKVVTWKYRNLINKFDYIIPNSQTCGYVLRQFYDVIPNNRVYPPVGIDMRDLLNKSKLNGEKNGMLVFAGDITNDHFSRDILLAIREFKEHVKEPIKLFVSNSATSKFFFNKGFEVYSQLPVEDLVNLYVTSKATYVPTT